MLLLIILCHVAAPCRGQFSVPKTRSRMLIDLTHRESFEAVRAEDFLLFVSYSGRLLRLRWHGFRPRVPTLPQVRSVVFLDNPWTVCVVSIHAYTHSICNQKDQSGQMESKEHLLFSFETSLFALLVGFLQKVEECMAVTRALLTTQSYSSSSSDISASLVISSSITFLTTWSTLALDFVAALELCVRMSSSLLNESFECYEFCLLGGFDDIAAIVAIR